MLFEATSEIKIDLSKSLNCYTVSVSWKICERKSVVKLGPGISFSWKRAVGITKVKRSISKSTGIPTTRSGRRNKLGRWMGMK